jgi:hypothetical protein
MDLRAGLDEVEKSKFLTLPGLNPTPLPSNLSLVAIPDETHENVQKFIGDGVSAV